MTEKQLCQLPGNEPGAGEWCRYYCSIYGTGRCKWDEKTHKCYVEVDSDAKDV